MARFKGSYGTDKLIAITRGVEPEQAVKYEWRKYLRQLLEQYYITDLDRAKEKFSKLDRSATWELTTHQ